MAVEQREPSFGQLLRELRVAAALTQEELAEEAGLSLRGISDLERGERRSPRIVTVRRLATALRLATDDRTALEMAARPKIVTLSAVPTLGQGGQLTSFVGRARELAEVTRLLDTERLVTLTGVGGIGKTRLALAVAERAAPDCADNAVLVELAALTDSRLVVRALASALGVRESADRPILDALLAALEDRHVLIVLDNCEHLLTACAAMVEAVLIGCPRVRILATSREPLGLEDEMAYAVPPLAVDDAGPTSVERLAVYGAVQLFVDRARAVWPTFELSEYNAQTVARVCRRLDGIPLAIELAAARTRVLSVEQIEARLDDRYRLLAWGAPNAPARHQTLMAAVDWSYALLSDGERLLFDRLSVFRGGCSLEAAEAVCSTDGLDASDVLDVLQSLVEKSLVIATPGVDGGVLRFGQLETLREYARTRSAARGEAAEDALRGRHLEYFRDLVERAERGLRGAEERAWLDRLDYDHDNVRAALAWSLAHDEWLEEGLRLAGRIWRFWVVRGHVLEARRWLEELLARSGPSSPNVRAKALDGAGVLAFQNADYDAALKRHEEALVLVRPLGDQQCIASVLSHLGSSMSVQGDLEHAQTLFEQSLAASRSSDDQAGVATVLVNLAITARAQGKTDEAHLYFLEALDLFRALQIRGSEANTLHGLGNIAHDRGADTLASTHYRDALALAQQVQDWGCVARCLESLAAMSAMQHRLVRAAQLYGAAEALREDIGIPITGPRRQRHESFIDSLKTQHDPVVLASAWKRGRAFSRERAVKFALGT